MAMISPLLRHNFLLSSSTVVMFSILAQRMAMAGHPAEPRSIGAFGVSVLGSAAPGRSPP